MSDEASNRDAFFAALKPEFATLPFQTAKASASKDRVKLKCPNGATGLIHVSTFQGDAPAGGFQIQSSAMVHGGPLDALLGAMTVRRAPRFATDCVFNAASQGLGGGLHAGIVRPQDDPAAAARRVVDEVRHWYLPLIDGFTGAWGQALDFALRELDQKIHPFAASSPSPLACALALAALARRPDRVPDITAAARHEWWRFGAESVGDPAAFFERAVTERDRLGL